MNMKRMKKLFVLMFTFCIMFAFAATVHAETIVNVPITVKENYTEASAFISYLNEQREASGKSAYLVDAGLMDLAMQRAAELCVYWGHGSPLNDGEAGVYQYIKDTDIVDSVYFKEDIAVGIANVEGVYYVWYNSAGHKPALTGNSYIYCGVGCVEYDGTSYWVLLVSDTKLGNTISAPSGITSKTRTVSVAASLLSAIRDDWTGGSYVYGESYDKPITCINKGDNTYVAGGYRVENASLLTIINNCPDIIQMDSLGRVKAVGIGSGTISVSVAGNTATTINFTVTPQTSGMTINGVSIQVSLSKTSYAYTGEAITPKPVVTDCFGVTLTEGVHYTLSYENNVNPTTSGKVVVNSIHEGYSGTLGSATFSIVGTKDDSSDDETSSGSGTTSGNDSSSGTTGGTTGNDTSTGGSSTGGTTSGSTSSSGNTSSGTVQTESKTFTIKLGTSSYTYNGKARKPKVTVYVNGKKLSSKYYSITYKNNKNVGVATVSVKGKGTYKYYSGKATFKINLKKATLSSVKSSKKAAVTVKWKKSSQNQGYQIQYSTNKKFKSGNATKNVSGAKKTSVTLTGLTSKKTYYVRVRTYKKVNGEYWYGAWSSAKKVKVK